MSGQLISLLFEVFFLLLSHYVICLCLLYSVYVLKDLFKTMNSQAVELMEKNRDKTRSSPSDFSQVMNMKFIVLDLHSFSPG